MWYGVNRQNGDGNIFGSTGLRAGAVASTNLRIKKSPLKHGGVIIISKFGVVYTSRGDPEKLTIFLSPPRFLIVLV